MYQNPDYPIPGSCGSFLMNTYQGYEAPQQQSMFYAGFGFNQPQIDADSRRTPPTSMINPFQQPQPQQAFVAQPQPFSAYGGSGMQANPQIPQLNATMPDSRRTALSAAPNPWVQPFMQSTPTPVVQPSPQWDFQMTPTINTAVADSRMIPLYNSSYQIPSFDKKNGVWENCFTENRQIPQPTINWNVMPQTYAQQQPFVPLNQQPLNPFANSQQQYQMSWNEMWNQNKAVGGF